jgi:DNA-binding NarL/FixJ family response regulator
VLATARASHGDAASPVREDARMRPRLVIVDDHSGYRQAVRTMLEADGFEVVGEAADGEEALSIVGRLLPDLVLLDIQLPGIDGFAVAARLDVAVDPPGIILISSRDAEEYGGQVEATRCLGFIAKGRLTGSAIRALAG